MVKWEPDGLARQLEVFRHKIMTTDSSPPETKIRKDKRNQLVDQNLQLHIFVSISHRIIINCGLDSARLVDDHDRIA